MTWAGILGGAIVYVLGMEIQIGWLVGAATLILFALSIAILAAEMSRAIELPEDSGSNEWDADLWRAEIRAKRESVSARSFPSHRTAAIAARTRRRKSRSSSLSAR